MRLEVKWTKLLEKNETTALLKIWSKEYVVNNPNGKIATRADIISIMRGGQAFPPVERIIEKITFNGNLAVVMGKELAGKKDTEHTSVKRIERRFTNVWRKTGQNWELVARQATGYCP